MSAKYEISRSQILAIILFCLVLIGLNLFLLKQNQELNRLIQPSQESVIAVGSEVLPLSGLDNSGKKVEIASNLEQKTLLLVFSSTCRFCEQNASKWKEILQTKYIEKVRIVGIALSKDGEKFLKKHGLEDKFSTLNLSPDNLRDKPLFSVTPQTILLNSEGRAKKVWNGVLDEKEISEILDELAAV